MIVTNLMAKETSTKLMGNIPFIKNILIMSTIIGIAIGCSNYFLSPVKKMDDDMNNLSKEIIVIQEGIKNLRENHFQHLEESLATQAKINEKQNEKLEEINGNVIRLMILIEQDNK